MERKLILQCQTCPAHLLLAERHPDFGWQFMVGLRTDIDMHGELREFFRVHQGHHIKPYIRGPECVN